MMQYADFETILTSVGGMAKLSFRTPFRGLVTEGKVPFGTQISSVARTPYNGEKCFACGFYLSWLAVFQKTLGPLMYILVDAGT